jgi:hypothetical protein
LEERAVGVGGGGGGGGLVWSGREGRERKKLRGAEGARTNRQRDVEGERIEPCYGA